MEYGLVQGREKFEIDFSLLGEKRVWRLELL